MERVLLTFYERGFRMPSQKLIPFYVLKVLKNETDEEHPLRAKEIQERVNRLVNDLLIKKTETVVENIQMMNHFFSSELDGNDLIGETQGFSGRYRGNRHYYYAERVLSQDEVHFLHRLVMGQKSLDQKASEEIKNKLSSLLSIRQQDRLKYSIISDSSLSTVNRNIYLNLDVINKAIFSKTNVRFEYLEYNLKKELVPRKRNYDYLVSPYGLVVSRGKYYLFARHLATKQIRTYRLDKIQSCHPVPETPYTEPEHFNVKIHGKQAVHMHSSDDIANVVLRCDRKILNKVIEEFSQCRLKEEPEKPEFFYATIPAVDLHGMRVWLRTYGHQVQVLQPLKLRAWLVQDFKRALELNEEI